MAAIAKSGAISIGSLEEAECHGGIARRGLLQTMNPVLESHSGAQNVNDNLSHIQPITTMTIMYKSEAAVDCRHS